MKKQVQFLKSHFISKETEPQRHQLTSSACYLAHSRHLSHTKISFFSLATNRLLVFFLGRGWSLVVMAVVLSTRSTSTVVIVAVSLWLSFRMRTINLSYYYMEK